MVGASDLVLVQQRRIFLTRRRSLPQDGGQRMKQTLCHPAPNFMVPVYWLNLEDALVQRDEVAEEMPFYLLISKRARTQDRAQRAGLAGFRNF